MSAIKIGVATDDGKTVSPHFGMAHFYLVFEIEDGVIKGKEMRPKKWHQHHGEGRSDGGTTREGGSDHHGHGEMLSNVTDCKALIAGGMGQPMHDAILQLGIKPYLTDIAGAEDAVKAYLDGTADD
jgi:predicted Fe-Mo cluster-binding NifX family protein